MYPYSYNTTSSEWLAILESENHPVVPAFEQLMESDAVAKSTQSQIDTIQNNIDVRIGDISMFINALECSLMDVYQAATDTTLTPAKRRDGVLEALQGIQREIVDCASEDISDMFSLKFQSFQFSK